MDTMSLAAFLFGAVFLILGMSLYTLGSEVAIEPIGSMIGSRVTRTKKLPIILLVCFLIGVIVTVAEPDLTVLATQVPDIPNSVLIWTVALGVGLFMLLAVFRIVLKWNLSWILIACYAIVFVLAAFVGANFVPLAFDSGGVTTGPITVPFIMALSIGISGVLGGNRSQDASFGMIGICSIGPILAVLVLGLFFPPTVNEGVVADPNFANVGEVLMHFVEEFPHYLAEVGIALAPIVVFFLIFNFIAIKLHWRALVKTIFGVIYTYVGLSLFLLGVNVGFMPAGLYIGEAVAGVSRWLTIPIGMVVGAVIVLAEPAVRVLNKQVEEITGGVIKSRTMMIVLSASMAVALGLAMLRVATGISIWWIILPGYAIALGLTFFVPKVFTGIAFDSGGVASGPMTATFLLPFAMGATAAVGGSIMTDAFGVVALVAMTPLVTIQILGLVFRIRTSKHESVKSAEFAAMLAAEGTVIDLTASKPQEPAPQKKQSKTAKLLRGIASKVRRKKEDNNA